MRRIGTVVLTASLLLAGSATAKPAVEELARTLAHLRTEVETLSADVEQKKEEKRARLRSLAGQKADLEFQLQREQRRIAELRTRAEQRRTALLADESAAHELRPALDEAMQTLHGRIRAGVPFKTAERLDAVDEIRRKLDAGLVTPQKATVQLWALVEDEMRLGRENGMYRQVIEIEDEEILADVARLGMVAMYFRTDDGRAGRAERRDGAWTWSREDDELDRRRVDALFEAMRKQIRTGFFELPGGIQ